MLGLHCALIASRCRSFTERYGECGKGFWKTVRVGPRILSRNVGPRILSRNVGSGVDRLDKKTQPETRLGTAKETNCLVGLVCVSLQEVRDTEADLHGNGENMQLEHVRAPCKNSPSRYCGVSREVVQ